MSKRPKDSKPRQMSDAAMYWQKVDQLLRSAVLSNKLPERQRLIDEAMVWRGKALELERAEARLEGPDVIPLPDDPSVTEPR